MDDDPRLKDHTPRAKNIFRRSMDAFSITKKGRIFPAFLRLEQSTENILWVVDAFTQGKYSPRRQKTHSRSDQGMLNRPDRALQILVVDDDEGMRALLRIMLVRGGCEVMLASDGLEALRMISERKPDVVVSDVMMPNLDGFGLLERVRANPETRSLPFVMVTARSSSADLAEGFGLGACEYLIKPVDKATLLAAVHKCVLPADIVPERVEAEAEA
jgi:CheY-like chemotaxis protein